MKFSLHDLRLRQGSFLLEVSAEIDGGTLGIFGSSGAGKTTLIEVVAGLRRPSSGRLAIDGQVLMDLSSSLYLPPEKRGIGYVPQDLALFPHLDVRRNLLYGRKEPSASGPQLDRVAEVLKIESLMDQSVFKLSGGQQQRVAFARALLASPRLLLMDEPLASLDHDLKLKIIPYLKRIRDEFRIPMLYVSHSPVEVAELCDQVLVLRDGKCLRICPPEEIFEATSSVWLKPGVYDSER